ncbi:Proteasome_activator pa28 beta subunit [Hexamita inflata]|uniref:Proteasome activator pa28 beta subunit n=1 Tax=Hexamita inflata TaxID=28002 RepID=A0AA86QG42_9EUKA|nr:Proteasome activator pa28 beta subunit [Hexamita inflata]
MTEVQKVKKVKKSKEAQQLLKSMKETISLFQEQAERTIFILLPQQLQELDTLSSMAYFQPEFETKMMADFAKLQDIQKPFVDEATKNSPLIIQPSVQFLEIEQAMNDRVQVLATMVTQIRRSVETLQWKKRSARQEEIQRTILAQLEVTSQNLQQITNLFLGYHEARADIVYSVQKYGCIDYFHLLPILEQKLCRALKGFTSDFRIHLIMLYDLLTANYDNILGADQKQQSGYVGYM